MTGHGRFEVVTGPMFSGKTEALLRLAWRSRSAGESCVLIKPALDTRHASSLMISHGGGWAAARVADDEQTILQVIGSNRIVAVDEAQFFGPGLIDVAVRLRRDGRLVVAAGLDLDFRREPFGEMPRLKEAADRVLRLRAECHRCGRPADYTQRLIDGLPASSEEPVVRIGGSDLYEARCDHCYGLPSSRFGSGMERIRLQSVRASAS